MLLQLAACTSLPAASVHDAQLLPDAFAACTEQYCRANQASEQTVLFCHHIRVQFILAGSVGQLAAAETVKFLD